MMMLMFLRFVVLMWFVFLVVLILKLCCCVSCLRIFLVWDGWLFVWWMMECLKFEDLVMKRILRFLSLGVVWVELVIENIRVRVVVRCCKCFIVRFFEGLFYVLWYCCLEVLLLWCVGCVVNVKEGFEKVVLLYVLNLYCECDLFFEFL